MTDRTLIPGFTCRPAVLADAAAAVELIRAAEQVDVGEALLEQSDVEAAWASQDLDLNLDSLVVFYGDRLAAVAHVLAERADVDVHPEFRGRGLGVALIDWCEARARTQAGPGAEPRVGQTVITGSQAAGLLQRRGYEPLWDSWVLHLPAGSGLPAAEPQGVEIRPYEPAEEQAVYTIVEAAFNQWPGRKPQPFAAWQEQVTKRADFDPSLLLVAVSEGQLVGAAFGIHYPGEGWVDQIAVVPSHRSRGIASAMLAALHREFRSRGESVFRLNTDSRTGALDLYLRLGMEIEHSFTRLSRALH